SDYAGPAPVAGASRWRAGDPPPARVALERLSEREEQLGQGAADLVGGRDPDRPHDALLVDHDVVRHSPETETIDIFPRLVEEDRAVDDVVDLAEMEGLTPRIDVLPHVDHDDLEPVLRGSLAHFLE